MVAPSPPALPRHRFSLLTGPWHTSSRVVAGVVLLILIFCNLPGQEVAVLRFGDLPPVVADIGIDTRLEHGWPLTFLSRKSVIFRTAYGPGLTIGDCFQLWKEVEKFRPAALAVNAGIAIILAIGLGVGFEAWRRARNRLFQVHLRDLLALVLVVSVVGAWFLNQRQQYAEQQELLGPLRAEEPQPIYLADTYEKRGITWLRLLAGDRPF